MQRRHPDGRFATGAWAESGLDLADPGNENRRVATDAAYQAGYRIAADPERPDDQVWVTEPDGRTWRVHREDADSEHRFTAVQLAATWFGNEPASDTEDESGQDF